MQNICTVRSVSYMIFIAFDIFIFIQFTTVLWDSVMTSAVVIPIKLVNCTGFHEEIYSALLNITYTPKYARIHVATTFTFPITA